MTLSISSLQAKIWTQDIPEYETGLLTTSVTMISDVTLHVRVMKIRLLYRMYLLSLGNFFSCWSTEKCGTFMASYYPVNSSLVDIQCQSHHCQQSQLMSSLSQQGLSMFQFTVTKSDLRIRIWRLSNTDTKEPNWTQFGAILIHCTLSNCISLGAIWTSILSSATP